MITKCRITGEEFDFTEADQAFLEKVAPKVAGNTLAIPRPSCAPLTRARRRFAYINQLYVYSRTSSATGQQIFSMFPEDVPFPVYENELWWSDKWSATEYGVDFDFSRPFFEQFKELSDRVPHFARMVLNVENCDYSNNLSACKNCYLVFNTRHAEDCFNCENVWGSRDCLDCSFSGSSELCYDCVTCDRCYNVQSSLECQDCSDSYYLLNCRSCKHCFGCVNLRHKEYCIYNVQHSKEEYLQYIAELSLESFQVRERLELEVQRFWQQHPRPHMVSSMAEGVSGNYIFQSRNVHDSGLVRSGENLRYCFNLFENVRDCYDYTAYGHNAELVYESARCGNDIFNLLFCYSCYSNCSSLLYCAFCTACEDCFGCVGMNKKQYCIFNKQYTQEEYSIMLSRIVEHMRATGEWGEFFPPEHSPFPYNHSLAQRYFPLTKGEIESAGMSYHEKPLVDSSESELSFPDVLPESDEPVIGRSTLSNSRYRVSREELKRLRKFRAPLPRLTYDERMSVRAAKMSGIKLYERRCAKTGVLLQTAFPPEAPWIVWDREEYESEFA